LGQVAGSPGMVAGTACAGINGMIFCVCMRFVPLLLSIGLTVKDTTLFLVYRLWSENISLKRPIFERFQIERLLSGTEPYISRIVMRMQCTVAKGSSAGKPHVEACPLGAQATSLLKAPAVTAAIATVDARGRHG